LIYPIPHAKNEDSVSHNIPPHARYFHLSVYRASYMAARARFFQIRAERLGRCDDEQARTGTVTVNPGPEQ